METAAGTRWADIPLKILYKGTSEILRDFLLPVLARSVAYDRLTGFFSVNSLVASSSGIEQLWRNGGRMRLVLGLHDIPVEVLQAHDRRGQVELMEVLESRLLAEVSSLSDEFHKDTVATLAWMMQRQLLTMKVAEPLGVLPHHIFHSKLMIFRDDDGNVVTATGSPNETLAGHSGNYEDITVHMSWSSRAYTDVHQAHFETVWSGLDEHLAVHEFSEEFVAKLLLAAGKEPDFVPSFARPRATESFLASVRAAPALGHLSYSSAILYPHQERVLRDGLNRNALRVLLADEVGLGKTLEAGALINHAVKFTGVKDVCILAPASLVRQFQEELSFFFELEFHVWDSSEKFFRDSTGSVYQGRQFKHPLDPGRPRFTIISSQLARGSRRRANLFSGVEELPEMLVVDEAHAARVRSSQGRLKPTRLWKTIDTVSRSVRHVVLMTATPIQMDPLEFHGLLRLLGLPETWSDTDNYLKSLEFASNRVKSPKLQDSRLMVDLLSEALRMGGAVVGQLSLDERSLVELLHDEGTELSQKAVSVLNRWHHAIGLLNKVNPANGLVIRNTRRGLENIGYKFPEREFKAPELSLTPRLGRFFESLDAYLDGPYGSVEEAADPDYQASRSFARVSYQQRVVSSLYSAEKSLERRLQKIEAIESGRDFDVQEEVEDFLDVDEEEQVLMEDHPSEGRAEATVKGVKYAAAVERSHVNSLLTDLRQLSPMVSAVDPKFIAAMREINESIATDKILVFSKYTDTLDGFLELITTHHEDLFEVGVGLYTGKNSWIQVGDTRTHVTKTALKRSLDHGEVRLVLCSDAASEGLNLQAARSLINLDVPWNPARLEQRIGRIARLGQTSDTVDICNLWYPDSVEARIYKRLLSRKDLYELAVGEFPEVVGSAIRAQVRGGGGGATSMFDVEALARLEEARFNIQLEALGRVWGSTTLASSSSGQLLAELHEFLERHHHKALPAEGPTTFGSIRVQGLGTSSVEVPARDSELFRVVADGRTWGFGVRRRDGHRLVHDAALVTVLAATLGDRPLTASDCSTPIVSESEFLSFVIAQLVDSFPSKRQDEFRVVCSADLGTWCARMTGSPTIEVLGPILWQ